MHSSSKHIVTTFLERPKAIAIVLGHLGTSRRELQRLSQLYVDRQCAVVAARSPPLAFFLAQHGRLKPVAQKVLQETASLLRQCRPTNPEIPVVIHMFSNGGAFLWEEIMKQTEIMQDLDLNHRLQYVAYDSSPCYLHMPWRLSAPYWQDAFPFPGWSTWARNMYLVGASLSLSMWCVVTCSLRRSDDFWTSMRKNSNPPCQHLVYLYTTNDKVSDATRIDELIEEQRREQGKEVTVYRYQDSGHCQLVRDHRDEYGRAIDCALKGAIERGAKRNSRMA